MTTHIGTTRRYASWTAIGIAAALMISGSAPAQSVSSHTLLYATYDGEKTADEVFKTMKSSQKATGEHIESYAIVSKDANGKTRVHDQRKKDAAIGAVLGAAIGAVGGPAGAAAGAAAGGGAGYLTGDTVGIPRETVDSMKAALTPGTSAFIVVLDDRWVQDVEKGLRQANARQVIVGKITVGAPNTNNNPAAPKPSNS